ncbi:MAG: tyrosine--tRNA ligase [Myxococcaceae bacterium]|nr:tyrosine--tRNA ligase [Myxococcaceae bacterium]MBH2006344.1 tyrosine--tRNA ligase [Myxococcaceae bacterium]
MFISPEIKAEFQKKLEKNRPLVIKIGFDPTAPDIHLGHVVVLTQLRKLQDEGHQIVFIIGDFTARIGDPTGKNVTRPALSEEEIRANAETYRRQVFKVLDPNKTQIRFNSEWFQNMNLAEFIRIAAKYSVARMIERDDFKKRLSEGRTISMHEILYPLLQGYDSVVLKADLEMGGQDQLFNLLVGRDLMRHFDLEPQCVGTVPLLEGLDGHDKMSKSLGNYVGVEEDAHTQFGKLMSVSDELMWRYYDLLSLKTKIEIEALKAGHPKEAKIALALEIVERFHDAKAADAALQRFNQLFGVGKRSEVPADAPSQNFKSGLTLMQLMAESGLSPTNAETKRLLKQGAVLINGERESDGQKTMGQGEYAIRVGKTRWLKASIV